jgi:glycosyltransferase involved in cell wall biosynthesis
MGSGPLASVVINNFNYGRLLGEAIDSALSQSYAPLEVVVVDDGSTDGSRDVIAGYGSRVKSVLKANGGQGSTFNAGFAASAGEIVCFLDADDRFFPDKVARVADAFARHPQAGWCFHALRLIDTRTGGTLPQAEHETTRLIDFREPIKRGTMPWFAPATSAISYRRELLQMLLPMPELEGTSADRYLKMAGLGLAPGVYLDEELAEQKIHGENAYSLRPDKSRVGAKSLCVCAHWIRSRFPDMARCTNKMMGMGLGMYRRSGGVDPKYAAVIDAYLAGASTLERWEIRARALYHSQTWMRRVVSAARNRKPVTPAGEGRPLHA